MILESEMKTQVWYNPQNNEVFLVKREGIDDIALVFSRRFFYWRAFWWAALKGKLKDPSNYYERIGTL